MNVQLQPGRNTFIFARAYAYENFRKRIHFFGRSFPSILLIAIAALFGRTIPRVNADSSAAAAFITQLSDKDDDTRRLAAQQLGQMRSPDAVPALVAALKRKDNSLATQERFIDALGAIGDKTTIPLLTNLATRDPEDGVRVTAAIALHRIGDPSGIAGLESIARDRRQSAMVRSSAITFVALHQTENSTALLRASMADQDPVVREATVHALRHLHSSDATQMLQAAQNDPDPRISSVAKKALKKGNP
jgi:HEAT repeat protein